MTNDQSTVEKDDVLPPKPLPPPLSIFPLQPFVPDSQTRLTHSSSTYSRHLFTTDNISHSRWHDEFCNIYIYIYIYEIQWNHPIKINKEKKIHKLV